MMYKSSCRLRYCRQAVMRYQLHLQAFLSVRSVESRRSRCCRRTVMRCCQDGSSWLRVSLEVACTNVAREDFLGYESRRCSQWTWFARPNRVYHREMHMNKCWRKLSRWMECNDDLLTCPDGPNSAKEEAGQDVMQEISSENQMRGSTFDLRRKA